MTDQSSQRPREKTREDYLREEKQAKQRELAKRIALWGAVALGLAAMLWGLTKLGTSGGGPSTVGGGMLAEPVSSADWIKGDPNAAVTLVEYSDLQCPACRAAQPAVQEVLKQYGDKIRFVYRHYPLTAIHPNAPLAAEAAEAAGKQGKFWEMHDKLFDNQTSWSSLKDPLETFVFYAGELGLNKDQFKTDFGNSAVADKIRAQALGGDKSGVNATPTFFLNGEKVNLGSFTDLVTLVGEAIQK
jgi:protein-disulfide isomerase